MKNKKALAVLLVIIMAFIISACETEADREEQRIIDSKNDAIHHLEKYLTAFYTIEDYMIYKETVEKPEKIEPHFTGIAPMRESKIELMHESIIELMTQRGLEEVYRNRYMSHFKYLAVEEQFNSEVNSIDFPNTNYRDENNINIDYTVHMTLLYDDDEEKDVKVKGQASLLKDADVWLVNFDRKFEDGIQKNGRR